MTYQRPGAQGITRVNLTRGRLRVLLALLSGARNLHTRQLCKLSQVSSGTLFSFLPHLEQAGWVTRAIRPAGDGEDRYCYQLTGTGRSHVARVLEVDC